MKRFRLIAGGIAAACAVFSPETAQAVPAFPAPATVVQPDGSVIELRLLGDEFSHVTVNAAGETVAQDADGF